MKRFAKIGFLVLAAIFTLRVCLSFNKKKDKDVLEIQQKAVAVKYTPQLTEGAAVNPGVFGINIGFALRRELDKDSGFVQLLRNLQPNSLRFPGGTVANYYHPHLPVYGYKVGEIPGSLGSLYMEQQKRSENILHNFIRLCKQVNTGAVYCANVLTGTQEEIFYVLDELIKNQIPILGVELGNEFCLMEYRKKFPDADTYIQLVASTAAAIRTRYPGLKIVAIGADGVAENDMGARGKFMRGWNQRLAKENFYDAYAHHPYRDCPSCDKSDYFDKVYTSNLQALAPTATDYLKQLGFQLAGIYGSQHKLWLTEWNLGNLQYLDNTMMQGAFVYESFLQLIALNAQYNNFFEVTHLHSMDGIIHPQKGSMTPLLAAGNNYASVQYFAFRYLSNTLVASAKVASGKMETKDTAVARALVLHTFSDKQKGKVYVHYVNRSGRKISLDMNIQLPKGKSLQWQAVEAEVPYATAGKTFFEKEYPAKLRPVQLRKGNVSPKNIAIAPYSFGYLEYPL